MKESIISTAHDSLSQADLDELSYLRFRNGPAFRGRHRCTVRNRLGLVCSLIHHVFRTLARKGGLMWNGSRSCRRLYAAARGDEKAKV